jgi:hypothetical protein
MQHGRWTVSAQSYHPKGQAKHLVTVDVVLLVWLDYVLGCL